MAIKKQVQWDGKKFRGFVDLGNGIENDDSLPLARDALVLMVVLINSERAILVGNCLKKLFDVGVKVVSLTCDGPSYNFAMLSELGAILKPSNLLPSFPNPEGIRMGNKLKLAHIAVRQQKMKVNLAAQIFNSSVADALLFCSENFKLSQFGGCGAAVEFNRIIDRLYDILKSRNPFAKGYK
ncbi:uncharacterized protein LOC136088237 [Hydra vulgaris]|uniref:Uncharacterized protein LOC136088237 n=1 Tax=Hydra vulgaris TaxID=6087 RepID=A0ABM4D165_HYDVU